MSPKAEEFISDEEIRACLAYAEKNKNNRAVIEQILEKAAKMKGISHKEALVLLDCELDDENEKIYALARKIKDAIRIKPKGSDGGHNGLKNIAQLLQTPNFARLRFGVGNDFPQGGQIDYVLGHFDAEQRAAMPERVSIAVDAIKAFCLSGAAFAMNNFNNK